MRRTCSLIISFIQGWFLSLLKKKLENCIFLIIIKLQWPRNNPISSTYIVTVLKQRVPDTDWQSEISLQVFWYEFKLVHLFLWNP